MFSRKKKLTEEDCEDIYDEIVNEGEDAGKRLCFRKGYKIGTYYKCRDLKGILHPKWTHPDHKKKWCQELIDLCCNEISENPILTLEEIIGLMHDKYEAPKISETTLSSYLSRLINMKICDQKCHQAHLFFQKIIEKNNKLNKKCYLFNSNEILLAPNANIMIEKRQNACNEMCQKCKWAVDETELLIRLNNDFNGNMAKIAPYFPKRSYKSVENKLIEISKKRLKIKK